MAKPAKKPRPADTLQVKPYVERAKALMLQQKEIGSDLSDVCKEAKEVAGLDPTTLRFVAREALMDKDKRAERDSKREEYLHALGLAVAAVESGELSARQAAKVYSIGKSSVYKEMSVRAVSTDREMIAADFELPKPEYGDDGITDAAPQGDSTPLAPQADEVAASTVTPAPMAGERAGIPFLGDDPGEPLDFLKGPSPANRRAV